MLNSKHNKYANDNTRTNKPTGFLQNFNISPQKLIAAGSLVLAGSAIYKLVDKIKKDVKRKNIIDDLRLNDPLLSQVSEDQLLEWYATIYHFAPKFSLDKSAVKEVLENFARFGRVDVNTIKMIAETEKATEQASNYTTSWSDVLSGIAKSVSFGG